MILRRCEVACSHSLLSSSFVKFADFLSLPLKTLKQILEPMNLESFRSRVKLSKVAKDRQGKIFPIRQTNAIIKLNLKPKVGKVSLEIVSLRFAEGSRTKVGTAILTVCIHFCVISFTCLKHKYCRGKKSHLLVISIYATVLLMFAVSQ